MAVLSTIRDELKTRLLTIAGLHVYDTVPNSIQPPAAVVKPVSAQFHTSFAPAHVLKFEIVLLTSLGGDLGNSQDNIDPYLDDNTAATSVRVAIEGDSDLNSAVDDLVVLGWRNYGALETGGGQYMSVTFDVEVYL